jgi:2-(3-amino-3-carboxypropyl)histidine synthase
MMQISDYLIDIEKAVKTINNNKYKTVALQIPEGLKNYASQIVEYLEQQTLATIIVIADPCFGACDLVDNGLKNFNVEFVVHIGHTPIIKIEENSIPTVFINALSKKDVTKVVEQSLSFLEGKNIGIVSTAQHVHKIEDAKDILTKNNFNAVTSKGDNRISKEAQILGCNFSAATNILEKVDNFLFIGSGTFHPVGLLLHSKKPVIAADPYTNTVKKDELDELKDIILRQRYGAIANSKNAKNFGILIGTKIGQQRMELAYKIKELLKSYNKKSMVISMDYFSADSLLGFRNIDCYVSTACPRIAIDDYMQYKVPIITPIELEIVLGIIQWENYVFDQILE